MLVLLRFATKYGINFLKFKSSTWILKKTCINKNWYILLYLTYKNTKKTISFCFQVNVPSVSPAPRTASGDGSVRPSSAGSVGSIPSTTSNTTSNTTTVAPPLSVTPTPHAQNSAAPSPAPPSTAPSPAPSAPGTPAKPDSDKSNSPAPRPPSSTSYPVHKLKKAWLQRHSGEDGTEDTTGVVGSGSCVTLPLNIANKSNGSAAGELMRWLL